MFKHFATSIFQRRPSSDLVCGDAVTMTRSELQDLFRSEFETRNRSALEITARHSRRRHEAFAA